VTVFGKIIIGRGEVESTQNIARQLALEGAEAGTVVMAELQTAGRGRQGRSWFAPRGANVCMTVIGPRTLLAEAWQLSLVVAVAVCEAVREATEVDARVRFPNDVYMNNAKLAGVLIETVPHPQPGFVIPLVGIGVNVNIRAEDYPEDLRATATSLQIATGREWTVGGISGGILRALSVRWEEWRRGPLDEAILPRWHELADPNARRVFLLDGTPVSCRVVGLAADGTVTLEMPDGAQRSLSAAQVILE
jgi:BirA family biotin operon repressor/biotin-[acetyl-CoA-carboxylase] ligase